MLQRAIGATLGVYQNEIEKFNPRCHKSRLAHTFYIRFTFFISILVRFQELSWGHDLPEPLSLACSSTFVLSLSVLIILSGVHCYRRIKNQIVFHARGPE